MGRDTPDTKTLAARLLWLRQRSGLKQREAARLVSSGLTYGFLGKLERAELTRLGADHALALARLYGVRVEWLVEGRGATPRPVAVRAAVDAAKAASAPEAAQ